MRGENPNVKTDSREREAIARAKRRLLNAVGDARTRGHRPTKAKPLELAISGSDYVLLRSHDLIDESGLYAEGPIKLRVG